MDRNAASRFAAINADVLPEEIVEGCRKISPAEIRRPGRLGQIDRHGHMWYCFAIPCEPAHKDHRSFDSHSAMLRHLQDRHNALLDVISL